MIHIELTKDYFEYDIRGLVMAFFPQEEISLTKPGQEGKKKQQKKECSNVEDLKKLHSSKIDYSKIIKYYKRKLVDYGVMKQIRNTFKSEGKYIKAKEVV